MMSGTVVYYVTGHGFGHATRSIGLINCFLNRGYSVEVRTSLGEGFFVSSMDSQNLSRFKYHNRTLDVGAIQHDALRVDPILTLEAYYNTIHCHVEEMLPGEVEYLKNGGFKTVFVDATGLACLAAKEAGIPCVIMSNFTWDVIYTAMLSDIKSTLSPEIVHKYENMIDVLRQQYCAAPYYFRWPGELPLPTGYTGLVKTLPMGCRHSSATVEDTLELFKIPKDKHVAIIGFGGQKSSSAWNINGNMLPDGWVGLLLGATQSMLESNEKVGSTATTSATKLIPIPYDAYIPDIIAVADCVIGKLGYGTVSECIHHDTPLIYVPRTHWAEEMPLKEYISARRAGLEMSESDFFDGNWERYLEEALQYKRALVEARLERTSRSSSAASTTAEDFEHLSAAAAYACTLDIIDECVWN